MKFFYVLAMLLLIVGGLNWGAIGLFHYDAVAMVLAQYPMAIKAVYIAVGVAAVYVVIAALGRHK